MTDETAAPDDFVKNPAMEADGVYDNLPPPSPDPSAPIGLIPGADPGVIDRPQNAPSGPSAADLEMSSNAVRNMSVDHPEAAAALVREWGGEGSRDFVDNVKIYEAAVHEYATPELIEAVENAGLDLNPNFINAVVTMARHANYEKSQEVIRMTPQSTPERQNMANELADLMELMNTDPDRYKRPQTQSRINNLTVALHGDEVAVGHSGRIA